MLYRLLPVENGKDDGLFSALLGALESDNLGWDFVARYASDGENLMYGSKDSVLTRMLEVMPGLFVLKCFRHSFHLVAEHTSKYLSATADQLIHDIYNYFKLSPNRQQALVEFQEFVGIDHDKMLKPCQKRWLSAYQCVNRVLEQWPALQLFFTAECAETKSPAADRILSSLNAPYIKATLQFSAFVLGDLSGNQCYASVQQILVAQTYARS
ncbi:proteinral transcription factor ii-i repeat domain-containing protein 2 [Plakobranchus ocellatus]|uniref:Proteinral transcription factor ii-i repeat domain-containing protein 2 n=1 Tax=Plakobranchus ocellatus TaxID=259542 RepID=A0AAV4CXA7_9GAST|nr:proteinral transcription factor ii-i repeat domain-containing protein 2 [Plakobranchus ocellatus]